MRPEGELGFLWPSCSLNRHQQGLGFVDGFGVFAVGVAVGALSTPASPTLTLTAGTLRDSAGNNATWHFSVDRFCGCLYGTGDGA